MRSICGYLISGETDGSSIATRAEDLFVDPIIEHGLTNAAALASEHFIDTPDTVITIGFKPG
ncbi:MAG: hypothetical protein L7S02_01280, partial [Flavobacteriales bacterium]|nr:hypothetical protein [Flavobacteriales bacterium]